MHHFRTFPNTSSCSVSFHLHVSHCPINVGNMHIEPDPLRPFKASMSNIFLLGSVKAQCLASFVFFDYWWNNLKFYKNQAQVVKWSRKKQDYWDKTSNSLQQINNKTWQNLFPKTLLITSCSYYTFSISYSPPVIQKNPPNLEPHYFVHFLNSSWQLWNSPA